MPRRVTAYDNALKSAFGRVKDVSPDEAREAARVADDSGRDDLAAQLREYAADMELDEPSQDEPAGEPDSSDEPDVKPSGGKKKGKRKPKKGGKVRRAARQATLDEPADRIAGTITTGGSIFWSIALGTVVLVLLYVLVTQSERAAGLITRGGQLVQRAAYPRTAFPERYAPGVPGSPYQGPPNPNRSPR